jgi:hypothetical protein
LFHLEGPGRHGGDPDIIGTDPMSLIARHVRLALIAGVAFAALGCGSPSGSAVSASPTASPTPVSATPGASATATPTASILATPSGSGPAASPSLPLSTYDAQQPDEVALELYAGGGTALTGYTDCLITTTSCPVTARLMARFSAFADSRQAHNSGAGSSDPVCRGCQDPMVSVTVTSLVTTTTGSTVYVAVSDGGTPLPLAIIEIQQGGDFLVDDVQCVNGSAPDPQTSLYLVSNPSCPLADSG